MKIMSPKFWLEWHTALLVDSVSATIAYWHTIPPKVKWLIILDGALLAFLLFMFACLQGGQS